MHVYIFDFGDQIKIGQASDVARRLHTIEMASGRKVVRPFSVEADGEYERLMHKKLVDYRVMGEYFNYPYEEAVKLLKQLVASKAIEQKRDENQDSPLLPMDYFDRVQTLITKKGLRDKTNMPPKVFLESLGVDYSEFFDDRKYKMAVLEDSVEIAKSLGVAVEYLVTGELDKTDATDIIQKLESALEELKRL
ncbi:MAG: GIY-YIG nuclease family protein [Treponema sp.]|jgi:hypothetical protein|nr:GIY-YIG nuclease family protein [Treponema sp.]